MLPIIWEFNKSNGSIRLVTDFREVNQIVVKNRYVSEKVTTILKDIQQYSVCLSLDITNAYSQVRLHDLNLDTLGCRLKNQVFAYQRLPQGFCNSPSYFQRIVDNLIGTHKNVIIYQDDVLILSLDLQSHTKDVEAVISKLTQAGFKLNLSKCHFLKEECEFLGYKLCSTGICPTEEFLLRIKTYPKCQSTADLRKFKGIFNYIKHFIPSSSSLMINLNISIGDTSKKEGRKKKTIPEQVKEDIKRMINAAAKTNGIKFF
uniref:Reverse transcriptase domain-containing protein n=1 Tax=Strongyloides stercoralis TaxID=6248 RepID=A0A0K0DRZ0_STRER